MVAVTAMIYSEAGAAASMAALAFVSVGLWTLRVALTARDRKLAGAAVAAVEAVVFALVFSNLVANLGSWNRILGYAIGVAVGTIAGLMLNERMNQGGVVVEAVVPGDGADLRLALCSRGWPATAVRATGLNGPATMLFVAVPTFRKDDVLDIVRATSPEAFWSIRTAPAYHGLPAPARRADATAAST
jgi:uncharacterized protein YebE (UPF0316 family)